MSQKDVAIVGIHYVGLNMTNKLLDNYLALLRKLNEQFGMQADIMFKRQIEFLLQLS